MGFPIGAGRTLTQFSGIDVSFTSSSTLADLTGWSFTVIPGRVYWLDLFCVYDGATTGDAKLSLVLPSGATILARWAGALGNITTSPAGMSSAAVTASGVSYSTGAAGAGTAITAILEGLLTAGTTGGTCQVQGAQGTSDGTATIFHTSQSYAVLRDVASA